MWKAERTIVPWRFAAFNRADGELGLLGWVLGLLGWVLGLLGWVLGLLG